MATALKKVRKSRKKKSLIGLTIEFHDEEVSSPTTTEKTLAATASIADESLFTHVGEEDPVTDDVKKKDPRNPPKSPGRRKGKKVKRKSGKTLKSSKKEDVGETAEARHSSQPAEGFMCLSDMIKASVDQVENERTELIEKERRTSQLLQIERSKNKELQTRIIELENQNIASDVESPRNATGTDNDELLKRIRMLEAENELLKQKTRRQEQVIDNLAADQESKMKQQLNQNDHGTVASGTTVATSSCWSDVTSLRAFLDNVSEHSLGGRWESLEETSLDNFTAIPSGAKAQGEILQLRSTLGRTSKAYEQQTEELTNLKEEVDQLRQHLGLEPNETSGTKRRVLGAPRASTIIYSKDGTLEPVYGLSQTNARSRQSDLSQSDVNDLMLDTDLENLLDF